MGLFDAIGIGGLIGGGNPLGAIGGSIGLAGLAGGFDAMG